MIFEKKDHKKMTKFFLTTTGNAIHSFSLEDESLVEERIAFYKFKASLLQTDLQDVKYETDKNEWIPYIYDAQKVDTIFKRFMEILPKSLDELALLEAFSEDPLLLNKQCHNCGKRTLHYNDVCNRLCDRLVYERNFECRLGPSCPLCPFIIK
jgi:predicted DNA-binding transcriptional regulator